MMSHFQVKVFRGDAEITSEFTVETTSVTTGVPGLEEVTYETNVYNPTFRTDRTERGERFKCVARISKMPHMKQMASGIIEVKCELIF